MSKQSNGSKETLSKQYTYISIKMRSVKSKAIKYLIKKEIKRRIGSLEKRGEIGVDALQHAVVDSNNRFFIEFLPFYVQLFIVVVM